MLNKAAGQSCDVLGRAWPPAKSLLTWFFCYKTAAREKTALSWWLAFAKIKPTKINLSLFGRLSLPKVEDERRAVLLFGFDQDVVDVGLDGAHGKE